MKHLYLPALAFSMLVPDAPATAQQAPTEAATRKLAYNRTWSTTEGPMTSSQRPMDPSSMARGAAFYTEDFSGGAIPDGWTNVDDLTPIVDDPVFFEWSDDPSIVESASGSYPDLVGVFNAPGADNGFLWANSDRGLTVAPPSEHLTRLTTTAIDCSGQASVLFTMQSTIGVFNNNANVFAKLRVSTNLIDWVDFFPFPCLETGAPAPPCERFSANPQFVALDITSVAAGQAEVYLQFEWQGNWEYYWAIDDLQLSPLPDYDLVMNYAYTSSTGLGEEYGRIPVAQLPAAMNVGAEVLNFGALEQTSVVVNMSLTDQGSTEVLSLATDLDMLAPQELVLTDEDITLPSLTNGLYTATFTLSSDQIGSDANPGDNTRVRTFEVTDFLYSLDNIGNHPPGSEILQQTGTASFTDNSEGVKLLNMYYVNTPMQVTGFEIGLGASSRAGGTIVISILDTVDVLSTPSVVNQPVAGIESDPYTLTEADVAAGVVTIAFPTPINLPINAYYAVATINGSGTLEDTNDPEVFILDDLTVPQPGLASALWIPFDPPENQNFYGGNGTAWAIRMSSNPSISVAEFEELEGVTMYPNPTRDILRISTEQNDKLFVEVMDMLGKVVMSTNFSGNTVLDVSPYAKGVYSVRISNGNKATVQRVTLY